MPTNHLPYSKNLNPLFVGEGKKCIINSSIYENVHFRNSNSGNTSMQIDSIQVYGEKTATYLSCTGDSVGYRFGFNGQEKDNEVTGIEGAHNTAEYWMYETRLGRRWNVDPVYKQHLSNYSVFRNSPIIFIDPNGDTDYYNLKGVKIASDDKKGNGRIVILTNAEAEKYVLANSSNLNNISLDNSEFENSYFELPSFEERNYIGKYLDEKKASDSDFSYREYGGLSVSFEEGMSQMWDFNPGEAVKSPNDKIEINMGFRNVIDPNLIFDNLMQNSPYFKANFYWHSHPDGKFEETVYGWKKVKKAQANTREGSFVQEISETDKLFSKQRDNVLSIVIGVESGKAYFTKGYTDLGELDSNFFFNVKEGE